MTKLFLTFPNETLVISLLLKDMAHSKFNEHGVIK